MGQLNGAGVAQVQFLKVFAGEVLTTFDETNLMKPLHMTRTISSGKSATFPVVGTAAAEYHVPGAEIPGVAQKHAEQVVIIDGLLISHVFISNLDEAMNHYDVRGPYAHNLGQALANRFDRNCLVQAYNGGFQTTTITGGKPAAANQIVLAADTDKGTVLRIAGINILKSNHLPPVANDTTADTGIIAGNTYTGDFRKFLAVGFHKSAIGTVQLMGLKVEAEYDIRRQGHLMVAKYALGTKWLRPESCYQINYLTNQASRA